MKHSQRFLDLVEDALSRVPEMDVQTFLARQGEGLVLVDVREQDEFAAGHPDGAIHRGKGILERDAEATWPDLDTPLVLLCGGGFRSALAGDALLRMGYRRVWSLAGGWKAWRAAGAPIAG